MKAMLFAAGLGTRLRPLTLDRPKALVEICGKPLLQWNLEWLSRNGVTEVVINVHHFAEKVEHWLENNAFPSLKIHVSNEREQLLETGGGLWNARDYFRGEPHIIVTNSDVITDFDLGHLLDFHKNSGGDATLWVRKRVSARYLLFSEEGSLVGWKNSQTGATRWATPAETYQELAFSGVQILNPGLLFETNLSGAFPLVDFYLEMAKCHRIQAFEENDSLWMDLGKVEELPSLEAQVRAHFF